jgi:NhaA family Na+:H+ antiporter
LKSFRRYKKSVDLEILTSIGLILSTILALIIYNSPLKSTYTYFFNSIKIAKFIIPDGLSIHMFINEFLMAIFFLVAGLEIKHEILFGNLSSFKKASFPVISAIGGVLVPAFIFLYINKDTPFLNAVCIPISTDIAFAVGIYFLFKNKLNPSLKVFLLSLAVVDDLISILAIATFYSLDINVFFVFISICLLILLIISNKVFNIENIWYYLFSGLCLWYFVYLSNIHSTISGVLLAMVIPASENYSKVSPLEKLQSILTPINSLIIIPLFAFANTGINLNFSTIDFSSATTLSKGIILGLCIGKPVGITLFSILGCICFITEKPKDLTFMDIFLASLIAGIGFTMSIFISEITFIHNLELINIAKISILSSALISIFTSTVFINIHHYVFKRKFNIHTA